MSSTANQTLFNRPDTLLGICEGIGHEFGVHPNILRVALAIPLVWNPLVAIGVYLALGVALWSSRVLLPAPRAARDHDDVVAMPAADPAHREIALAA